MRLLLLAPAVLMCQSLHAADSYELHHFTQDHSVCPPCAPVDEMVRVLVNQGYAITSHKYQDDEQPFKFFGIGNTPSFMLLKNGAKYRYYEQSPGYRFSAKFLAGMAPMAKKKSVQLDPTPVTTARADCANPIGKAIRNLLPPPPAPGVRDVPDVQKVERIIALEKRVSDLESQLAEQLAALKRLDAILKQRPAATHTTEQITKVDDRPITVRMQGIRELADGTKVVTKSEDKAYPRGTPVVLQFNEKFLE
jgi:uncharacterized coiled-coil protein SlyX